MCLLFFRADREEVKAEEQDLQLLRGSDGSHVLWNPATGAYYNPDDGGENIQNKQIIIHSATNQPRTMYNFKYHQNGHKWTQPTGSGYQTIDEAIEAARRHGIVMAPGSKIHVMKTDQGGWDIVGVS